MNNRARSLALYRPGSGDCEGVVVESGSVAPPRQVPASGRTTGCFAPSSPTTGRPQPCSAPTCRRRSPAICAGPPSPCRIAASSTPTCATPSPTCSSRSGARPAPRPHGCTCSWSTNPAPIAGYASACSSTAAASGTAPAASFRASGACAPSSRWSSTRGRYRHRRQALRRAAQLLAELLPHADQDAVRTLVVYLWATQDRDTARQFGQQLRATVSDREVIG